MLFFCADKRTKSSWRGWLPGSESSEFYLKPIGRLRDQVLGFEFLERFTAIPSPYQCQIRMKPEYHLVFQGNLYVYRESKE
jgi:hypothetical protein